MLKLLPGPAAERHGTQLPLPAQIPEEQREELCKAHEEDLTAQYETEAAATRPPLEGERSADEASVLKQCALLLSTLCRPPTRVAPRLSTAARRAWHAQIEPQQVDGW